jgi:hypothetical protein
VYWQRRYIAKQRSLASDAATERVELPGSNFLSGLVAKLAWTNGTTGSGGEDVIDAIDLIEVIANGSQVLFSLSGIEISKWAYPWTGKALPQYRCDFNGEVQDCAFLIPFGRFLGDPDLYLDLAAFSDLELRITYSPTIAATAFLTATGVLDVIALMAMEGPPPGIRRGYLRHTTLKTFTSVASGDEEVDLSRRHPYHSLMVYAYEAGIADGVDITELELEVDAGRITPYKARFVDAQEENELAHNLVSLERFKQQRTDGESIETRCGRIQEASIALLIDDTAAADYPHYRIATVAGGQITVSAPVTEGTATWAAMALDTVDRDLFVNAKGRGIGNAVYIPFCIDGNLDLVLPAPDYDSLKLILTQGGAGAACRVSAAELVR